MTRYSRNYCSPQLLMKKHVNGGYRIKMSCNEVEMTCNSFAVMDLKKKTKSQLLYDKRNGNKRSFARSV